MSGDNGAKAIMIIRRETRELGRLMGVGADIVREVERLSSMIVEKNKALNPRDVVKAVYHVILNKRKLSDSRKRALLVSGGLSWFPLVKLVEANVGLLGER